MKVITVQLSWDCDKEVPCSFCYLRKRQVLNALMEPAPDWRMVEVSPESKLTVCFEYSGYNIRALEGSFFGWTVFTPNDGLLRTITTNHWYITETFCGFLRSVGIAGMALSYDDEKVPDPKEWAKAASIASKYFPVACNYLLGHRAPTASVIKACQQTNLLTQKPSGKLTDKQLNQVEVLIHRYEKMGLCVTTDNCLGVQLGTIDSCRRGVDFITIQPDGNVVDCCFEGECFLYERVRQAEPGKDS